MIYKNTGELIEFLKKNNIWTKKNLGQNFLVNFEVLQQIVKAADLNKEDYVIEVGPGLGILTQELATNTKKVKTIELDQSLIPILQTSLASYSNIEIEHNDALKTDLPVEPYKLVANIPYYITSPLLNHFLQPKKSGQKRPSLIVLLVQKEVAEKICAQPGDQSVLSLQVQIFGKPQMISIVNKSSFHPQPNVDSAILKIEIYPEPLIQDTTSFFTIIHAAFAQKRKTLLNSLQNGLKISKEQTANLLKKADIDSMRRPQTLSIPEWKKIIETWNAYSSFEPSLHKKEINFK